MQSRTATTDGYFSRRRSPPEPLRGDGRRFANFVLKDPFAHCRDRVVEVDAREDDQIRCNDPDGQNHERQGRVALQVVRPDRCCDLERAIGGALPSFAVARTCRRLSAACGSLLG
jgi:hypothetical protein